MAKKPQQTKTDFKDDSAVSQYMGDTSETGMTIGENRAKTGKRNKKS